MPESLWEKMDLCERVLCELPVHLQESNKYKHRITIQYRVLQTVVGEGPHGMRGIGEG